MILRTILGRGWGARLGALDAGLRTGTNRAEEYIRRGLGLNAPKYLHRKGLGKNVEQTLESGCLGVR